VHNGSPKRIWSRSRVQYPLVLWEPSLEWYHVELPGQISERSNSIVFFIKELGNVKK
jgi:hypothetical protein